MDEKEQKYKKIERAVSQSGYTLAEFIRESGRRNSTLLMMSDECIKEYQNLYMDIDNGGLSKREKGKKLEELAELLFKRSIENVLDVYKNCRTSTNEIDLLVRWTENAQSAGLNTSFPFTGEIFLCECKNYEGAVSVTYVGKFSSLMSVTESNFGVMISWDGVTGRGKWADSNGLIKKIALREKRYIVVLDKIDVRERYEKIKSLFSLLYDKYIALKTETDYDKYIQKHEAERSLMGEG